MKHPTHYIYNHQTSINRGGYDIELDCDMQVYHGTNDTDDPTDVCLMTSKVAEDVKNEKGSIIYHRNKFIELTAKEKQEVYDHYQITK